MGQSEIIYEDREILVCRKPAGMAVQSRKIGSPDLESELRIHLSEEQGKNPYLGIIHRLDQPVEGLLVFAKTGKSASVLNRFLADGSIRKKYYAVVYGKLPEGEQVLEDYLVRDGRTGTARVTERTAPGAKQAELRYRRIAFREPEQISLAEVELVTGRFHQIRVQMSSAGFPLLGDRKYGTAESGRCSGETGVRNVALCAYFLQFPHPVSGKELKFRMIPENPAFRYFFYGGNALQL